MLKFLQVCFALAFTCFPASALRAQSLSVQGGYISLVHDSTFTTPLRTYGINITGSANSLAVDKYVPFFNITGGLLDGATGAGEIQTEGGFSYSNNSRAIEVRRFTLDTTGAAPLVSGLVFIDGLPMGRMPLYIIYNIENLAGPLTAGPFLNRNNLYLVLSASFRNALNNFAHMNLPPNAWMGWLEVHTTFYADLGPM